MKTGEPVRITRNELCAIRMRAQCLTPRLPHKALVDVVKRLCGINAQLYSAMALSLRARVENLSIEDVEASRVTDRAVVRTWCMRGTMHLLATDDIDWLLSAVAPAEISGGWHWLERRGGLDRRRAEKVLDVAYETLKANGAMTRLALMDAVTRKLGSDVRRSAAGVVHLNGLLGDMCFGPDDGANPTYVALDDWLGRQVKVSNTPDYGELARRYLRGYGPAAPRDFATWWGLPLTNAKAAWTSLEDELTELDVEGQAVWFLQSEQSALKKIGQRDQVVQLVPAFDTYLLGYHNRDFAVLPKYQARVFHGGEIAPVILIDGSAAGTWRYESRGNQIRIKATPFSSFTPRARDLIAREADDIGRFFGLATALSFTQ